MDSDSADSASQLCATSSETEAPANVPDTNSPAEVSNMKHPDKDSDVEPLVEASDIEPPAEAKNVEDPMKASDIEPHAKVSNVEAPHKASGIELAAATQTGGIIPSNISSWAKTLKFPQPVPPPQDNMQTGSPRMSPFARFTSELGLRLPSMTPVADKSAEGTSTTNPTGVLESLTKGLVDSSRSAVKAVQVKARHIVSQNKRRYQEGEFDLDMTYITENIIAMGFPAGDISSGFFGYFEGKYKVYNLCSERLYDAALFQGKPCRLHVRACMCEGVMINLEVCIVRPRQMDSAFSAFFMPDFSDYFQVACFPFDDHNCPPIQLIASFCRSAYSWLKEDILNVVVVHCKAALQVCFMIGLLLSLQSLQFFPTAEEAIDYYNQKRCVDGKALVLPSQIRYVKYFERILTYSNGEIQPARRGFRLLQCPYWIRPSIAIFNHSGILFSTRKHPKTKDLMPEDFWIKAPKKGIVVFALPGEPGLTELVGDFKVLFHDRQGDFYCWLNTTMTENRKILDGSDLDGFDKRKVPSPGFQVEIVMIDYDGILPTKTKSDSANRRQDCSTDYASVPTGGATIGPNHRKVTKSEDNDDVFSDSDGEEADTSKSRQADAASGGESAPHGILSNSMADNVPQSQRSGHLSLSNEKPKVKNVSKEPTTDGVREPASSLPMPNLDSMGASDIKSMAADASVFSFGDDEDYESE
ncbi:phosphatidylinositol 3,4,5-trisphosphate 3-phosphatase and dual-specificity protein phosphatase pten [Citrus sinensis]|uniref:Phosphatidylinositol 3,4,5-trisphosphate 3-phosphatase and dual-specificity protein phosphatase pten n=1 Tax=Citrus sinensis TaxID=2711 RepID=A0ACB8J2Y4_CITSI|nr:phosphatidylinositol 3,4,5-trisphosphate 3-phosphatase and dual-specificity protein phosphatase pten [Citrus sinensis]